MLREKPAFVSEQGLSGDLPAFVGRADVIVDALPLTPETKGVFDRLRTLPIARWARAFAPNITRCRDYASRCLRRRVSSTWSSRSVLACSTHLLKTACCGRMAGSFSVRTPAERLDSFQRLRQIGHLARARPAARCRFAASVILARLLRKYSH